MNPIWNLRLQLLLAFAIIFIAGCAQLPGAKGPIDIKNTNWQGRLALRVHSTPEQSFSSHFDLQGNPQAGTLLLTTPLGTTLAAIHWSPANATLQTGGTVQQFDSLAALAAHVTGTDLPIASLFAWLQGVASPAPGWQTDLSEIPTGKLSAHRIPPDTPADLKIILDR